jgi:hypothetical protein
MIDYEDLKSLYDCLKLKSNLNKHWINTNRVENHKTSPKSNPSN